LYIYIYILKLVYLYFKTCICYYKTCVVKYENVRFVNDYAPYEAKTNMGTNLIHEDYYRSAIMIQH